MPSWAITLAIGILILLVAVPLIVKFVIGLRFIANTEVGIVEKIWGGGHLSGQIIALGVGYFTPARSLVGHFDT